MVATRHVMCEVELVEDDGARDAGRPRDRSMPDSRNPAPGVASSRGRVAGGPGRVAGGPGARRRLGRRWLAGLLGAVVAVGGGEVALQARARSAATALAGVDGVLAPLTGPVVELWRSDRSVRSDPVVAGGLLVVVGGAPGRSDVVALDPGTGGTVWRTRVRPDGPGDGAGGLRCVAPDAPPRAGAGTGGTGGTDPGGPAGLVVCLLGRSAWGGAGDPPPAPSGTDLLVVLDARTGEPVSRRPVPRGTALASLGGDVVTASGERDGAVHVTRTDPRGTTVRWAFVGGRPSVPRPPGTTRLAVVDDLVVVGEGARGWVLDPGGRPLTRWAGAGTEPVQGRATVTAGHLLARPHGPGSLRSRTEVVDLRSRERVTVPGRPLVAHPDDGTLDGSVLVRSGGALGLAAYDPATGRLQWAAPGRLTGRPVVVGGRVVRVASGYLTATDGRTGQTVWRTPLAGTDRTSLVTDGRLVVATQRDDGGGVVLGAYGLDDGRPRWTSDVADDIDVLTVVGRQLLGWTGEQLVALTAPGGPPGDPPGGPPGDRP